MKTFLRKAEGFANEIHLVVPPTLNQQLAQFPLATGLHVTAIGHFPRAEYHYRSREHGCQDFILIYCVDGKGWYKIRNHTRTVCQHEAFVLPPNIPHTYGADGQTPWTIYWAHFQGDHALTYFRYLSSDNLTVPVHVTLRDTLANLFQCALKSPHQGLTLGNLIHTSSALAHILCSLFFANPAYVPGITTPQYKAIEKVIYFMHHHKDHPLNLAQLADQAALSIPHFSRLFKLKTGSSPIDFFNRLRIQQACQQLITTELSVKEVAFSLGYSDPYYFSRSFKKVMGLSPARYRQGF